MTSLLTFIKQLLLFVFLMVGLGCCLFALVPGASRAKLIMWGCACFAGAGVVIWLDRNRHGETPEEQNEQFLIEVLKRFRKTGSLEEIVEEHRSNGADDYTLSLIRTAPERLMARAEAKIQAGYFLFVFGVLCTGVMYCFARIFGFSQYVVAIGALGVGSGLWLDGLRLRFTFRNLNRRRLQKGT